MSDAMFDLLYIMEVVIRILMMISIWSCTSPLQADDVYSTRGDSKYNPLYVKIVE